jgi:hypothetical protein
MTQSSIWSAVAYIRKRVEPKIIRQRVAAPPGHRPSVEIAGHALFVAGGNVISKDKAEHEEALYRL